MARKKAEKKFPKNIREREGKFTYRYYVPATVLEDGVEKKVNKETESPRFNTLQEAVDFGILLSARKLQKGLTYDVSLSVSSWSRVWLEEYTLEREPAKNTLKSREYGLKVINARFGAFQLSEVTPSAYQQFLYDLKKKGLSRSSITTVHTAASLMFKHAKRAGLINSDSTDGATIPKEQKKARQPGEKRQVLPKYLEKDELKTFLQLCRFMLTTNLWALFVVLAYTGLRISEAAGLQWEDIDFKKRTIDVNKQIYGSSVMSYSFAAPKNEQSERIVSFGETVAKALQLLMDWQQEERKSAKIFNPNDNFVFWCHTLPGYPIAITSIGKIMRKALDKAGLATNLTPHSLRHTHVSLLASNPRVGLPEIQARIGHKSNSKVTELIYLHVTKQRQYQIADDFEWAINN
ncbi:site-specific integrase [Paenibacillus sp. HN-1]|uniref:tyrosine-type recombinase/integrase n=1 Tax=Paenibacillus TaxID=44249 RepID=UPI001CA90DB0|nr:MULTISPECIES: tyrosine-type recombinase/integrase [Paenibacillus]MBY9077156.1 site-specific integrase [Paenibacillus sp. CGMCC 1.18879]MBY9084448.1 site-specific integrase [Paenibacillus sinensis]